ncbi:MAG: hypothetical protein ACM3P0_01700 [Acidobacteriota bacterium]
MKKSVASSLAVFMIILLYKPLYGQEAGISFGTSVFPAAVLERAYYPYIDIGPSSATYGATIITAKEVKFHFSYYLSHNICLDLSAGYGFSRNKKDSKAIYPKTSWGGPDNSITSEEYNSDGYPGLIELQFFAPLNESGTLIPFLGLGAGYCYYKTKFTEKNNSVTTKTDLSTKGFGQYVSAGLNIKFTDRFSVSLHLQKLLLSNLKTEKSNPIRFPASATDPLYNSSLEHVVQPGLGDVALSAGVKLYMGK